MRLKSVDKQNSANLCTQCTMKAARDSDSTICISIQNYISRHELSMFILFTPVSTLTGDSDFLRYAGFLQAFWRNSARLVNRFEVLRSLC